MNKIVIRKPIRVIGISEYLVNYFRGKGLVSERIPVIMDVMSMTTGITSSNDIINLIYAGSPLKKDLLGVMVKGICGLKDKERHVAGGSVESKEDDEG